MEQRRIMLDFAIQPDFSPCARAPGLSVFNYLERRKRVVRSIALASSLIFFSAISVSRADETLVMELPAFYPGKAAESAPPVKTPASLNLPTRNPAGLVRSKQNPPVDRRGTRKNSDLSIGRLGVASKPTTIFARKTSNSRALAEVPAGTYLALTKTSADWFGVLMADRTTGWMKKSAISLLDYEVVSNEPIGSMPESGQMPTVSGGYQAILQTAYYFLGVPYKWGGTSDRGMDCSAFVKKCFATVGIQLPRTSREQINVGMEVPSDQLQSCDRLYFANRSGTITHTGIYIGDGYFIHASSSRGGVAVSRLNEPMYQRMFAGARR